MAIVSAGTVKTFCLTLWSSNLHHIHNTQLFCHWPKHVARSDGGAAQLRRALIQQLLMLVLQRALPHSAQECAPFRTLVP